MVEIITTILFLIAVIDPIGSVPVYMEATKHLDKAHKRIVAIKGSGLAFLILLFFIVIGQLILEGMAMIGLFVLKKGKWKEEQIVSNTWIEESTTSKTKITGADYGYLWWNIPFSYKQNIVISKTVTNNGGQYIMVLPELDIVGVFIGGAYNSQEDKLPFAIMKDVFLGSLKD